MPTLTTTPINHLPDLSLIYNPNLEYLSAIIESVAASPTNDYSEIDAYSRQPSGYTPEISDAIDILLALDIFDVDENKTVSCKDGRATQGMRHETCKLILREALLISPPLVVFFKNLTLGDSWSLAYRRATRRPIMMSYKQQRTFECFIKFAKQLQIFEKNESSNWSLAKDIDAPAQDAIIEETLSTADSVVSARLLVTRQLEESANEYLDDHDQNLLAKAYLNHHSNPEEAIKTAAKGLENFLRHVAKDKGLEDRAPKHNGSGQLATMLRTKEVIHDHHKNLIMACQPARNADIHDKDKHTLVPWKVTPLAALATITTVLTAIRSIHAYVFEQRQIL